MPDREIIKEIENYYPLKIVAAYNNNPESTKALTKIVTGLTEIYRYFEPAFFSGEFYMCKSFDDQLCFPRERAIDLYDKVMLLNRTTGKFIIQIFNNDSFFIWENEDHEILLEDPNVLTYFFHSNREFFLANKETIEVTYNPKGSRYAPQFVDLMRLLSTYGIERIYQSSCPEFKKSWFDPNRLFFRATGSGNNIPEKHMQESLYEYLRISLRGISLEVNREFNVSTDTAKPKPIDLKIQWKEANRTALIETKWLGASKSEKTGKVTYNDSENGANAGYVQLKGYYDAALGDMSRSIIKAHLIVFDGRRNNLDENATTISNKDGMFFKDKELVFKEENKYYESISAFETPIRIFAAPITI